MNSICVFCSSSEAVAPVHFAAARELGRLLAARHKTLVYGGTTVGLMFAVAAAVKQHGGRVVGVIPALIAARNIGWTGADELVVTRDLRERKAVMAARADAFVALPGGLGTLEEALEILTLKQLRAHSKPVVFLNTEGFYDGLFAFFDQLSRERFLKPAWRDYLQVADQPAQIFSHLENYRPPQTADKWFQK